MTIPIKCWLSFPWKTGRIFSASATYRFAAARSLRICRRLKPKPRRISANTVRYPDDDLPIDGSIHWHSHIHWSGNWQGETNAARAVLEHLYATGELVIHHKKGTRKYYDLADAHIAPEVLSAPDPLPDEHEHRKWRVLRRIGAVGMLWNKNSDAYLGIWGLKAPQARAGGYRSY